MLFESSNRMLLHQHAIEFLAVRYVFKKIVLFPLGIMHSLVVGQLHVGSNQHKPVSSADFFYIDEKFTIDSHFSKFPTANYFGAVLLFKFG